MDKEVVILNGPMANINSVLGSIKIKEEIGKVVEEGEFSLTLLPIFCQKEYGKELVAFDIKYTPIEKKIN